MEGVQWQFQPFAEEVCVEDPQPYLWGEAALDAAYPHICAQQAAKELGGISAYIETKDAKDYAANMQLFIDKGYEQALRIAGKRHDLVGIVLVDPRERELPRIGLITLRDAETGRQQWIDTSDAAVRRAHAAYWKSTHQTRHDLFLKSKLDAVEIQLDQPYMKPLSDFFRRREKRW